MLVVGAIVGLCLWFPLKGAWIPPIVVGALTSAVTITIIDGAIRRQEQQRLQPRVDAAYFRIGARVQDLAGTVLIDYAQTHLDSPWPIPDNAVKMIDLWLAHEGSIDTPRHRLGLGEPVVIGQARAFLEELEEVRSRDREVLEHDLVQAIDDFGERFMDAVSELPRRRRIVDADVEQLAMSNVVAAARGFAFVFGRYAPRWLVIPESYRRVAQDRTNRLRAERDPSRKVESILP